MFDTMRAATGVVAFSGIWTVFADRPPVSHGASETCGPAIAPHARPREDAVSAPESDQRDEQSSVSSALQPKVVLVVEDDEIVLETAIENLHDLGYRTLRARDAAEAMAILRGTAHIDILFSDVVMPGWMNGLDLALEARRLRPDIRIALTSGYIPATMDEIPADMPMLPKPYLQADLSTILRRISSS
jgi:CheY-like chemotaxis protein